MRAHTTTTTLCHRIALALALGVLAIPASATAQSVDSDYSSVSAISGASNESTQPSQGSDYSSINSIVPPEPGATQDVDSGYSSLNSISGAPADAPTLASGTAGGGDGFDWASALVGAGTALAVTAFGVVALLTFRRRTAVTPTASTG